MDARRLTWPQTKALAEAGAVALLPIGSTEAHGPHLPLSTDVVIAEEVCRRVESALTAQHRAVVRFPPLTYGLTEFAAGFAGTISIPGDTFTTFLQSLVEGIVRHGFRTVALVNHHLEPAHFKRVHEAGKAVAQSSGANVIVPDHRRGPHAQALGDEFLHGGSHAGHYETSLVLAADPTLVLENERAALPDLPIDLPGLIKAGRKTFEECGGTHAYFGSPRTASVAEGERLYASLVAVVLESIGAAST
jgi:creatinine amidohydrolase